MRSGIELTYCVNLDQDVYVWIFEIDLMSWSNNRRNLLDDFHALHDGVIADCRTDRELEVVSNLSIVQSGKTPHLCGYAGFCMEVGRKNLLCCLLQTLFGCLAHQSHWSEAVAESSTLGSVLFGSIFTNSLHERDWLDRCSGLKEDHWNKGQKSNSV
jgi:hypothetical protein